MCEKCVEIDALLGRLHETSKEAPIGSPGGSPITNWIDILEARKIDLHPVDAQQFRYSEKRVAHTH